MSSLTRAINFASPWGWAAAAVCLAVFATLIFIALGGIGFRFDPFKTTEKRAERAEARAVFAEADAGARAQEVLGADDTTRRVETVLGHSRQAAAVAADFTTQARAAPDADETLSPERSARLHGADERLCDIRPALCHAVAAAPADARDR